ncbi:acyl-CoA dehydratase activase [Desulfatirhabdium butyrativorans]|uniref:acyl-CoA dehydratase activase n=1 Tax=Desulfatirhabdium butyrativorans TaxID=340467 RepID=UPI000400AD49|nr:acyl-CoA dehydratase activase [Desulfatirhabdium butyrativorans]
MREPLSFEDSSLNASDRNTLQAYQPDSRSILPAAEAIGLCLGASTIGAVGIRGADAGIQPVWAKTRCHEGNPRAALHQLLLSIDGLEKAHICATGRKFRHCLELSTISEPESIEIACRQLFGADHPYRAVVSAGGETFMVYHLDGQGRIQGIHSGNKCASGTGEFFLQQIGRMAISLDEIAAMELPETIHPVSGRCSVFCKSDCTHALNKGVPKARIIGGLTRMMALKIVELLKKLPRTPVLLIGGCTRNRFMVHYLRQEIGNLHIPDYADCFEALGAAIWSLHHPTLTLPHSSAIFRPQAFHFSTHQPLSHYTDQVVFKSIRKAAAQPGDRVILGLDVGSTTTKGILLRRSDKAILASEYLRTGGDPIAASRAVYRSLAEQIRVPIRIEGLGVTGSGRQIAGLHAMSRGVINEIIAHAAAAVHFDPEVDTIFEIGGQDAKYTFITNAVPSDYAMNEACSAGTGSFLEEAAAESLGIPMEKIGDVAFQGDAPPNFSDQCAAFIGSDIKRAAQIGIPVENIVAGLVYSICMNYANRVKGNRPVGKKIFMQGGVCYNRAIPVAMAAITGKHIVVPPEPGLMGAFGVALEVERRIDQGLLEVQPFDLIELRDREVAYKSPFECPGTRTCDRRCTINRIVIGRKTFPFGGICNRYDNIIHRRKIDAAENDWVIRRDQVLLQEPSADTGTCGAGAPAIGMNRSFLIHTYFPFFNHLFQALGMRVLLPQEPDSEGIDRKNAAFCHPVELAHGYMADLLRQKPDRILLPHIAGLPSAFGGTVSCTCPFVQAESAILKTAFPELGGVSVLSPCIDFSKPMAENRLAFRQIADWLGVSETRVSQAAQEALAEQQRCLGVLHEMGRAFVAAIEEHPERFGVILFGRPYNAFSQSANKGIPAKFATRGIPILPMDMLKLDPPQEPVPSNMYWAMGQLNLAAARFVRSHPQLFGVFITNFSCGPDSFVITYFRDIMGAKPSLTLELDSHTADAGLETRIEAFLDIVQHYRRLEKSSRAQEDRKPFRSAAMQTRQHTPGIRTSEGHFLPLTHPDVKVILPALGRYSTLFFAGAFQRCGIRAAALPPADESMLKMGRGQCSCKECLPLQTCMGSFMDYLGRRPKDEVSAFFMASAEGPCRFGQYHVFFQRFIETHRIPNTAILPLNSVNGYGGLGTRFTVAGWRSIVIGDLFAEMHATLLAGAVDPQGALRVLDEECAGVSACIQENESAILARLGETARRLSRIPLKAPYAQLPKISLIGEIYVRHDPISLQGLIETLAGQGFVVRTAPVSEWILYTDWLTRNGLEGKRSLDWWIRYGAKRWIDSRIRRALAPSGLIHETHGLDVGSIVEKGGNFIPERLTGETILTVGAAFHDMFDPACGVISIGPFGCMPSRIAEAVLYETFRTSMYRKVTGGNGHVSKWIAAEDRKLPFLSIETDGNPFPQLIEARLEAFCLQARRFHERMIR